MSGSSITEPGVTEPVSAFTVLRPDGAGSFVLLCDHASNQVPAELDQLGLKPAELARHIAWDIGAAAITTLLSEHFDATAILCGTSRLVIDCNRQLAARDLIPEISDGTLIPGNRGLDDAARAARIARWFAPYHDAIERVLTARNDTPIIVSVHSMTDRMAGIHRPWPVSLSSHQDRRFVEPMLAALRLQAKLSGGDFPVGDNQPYDLDPAIDYSTPIHAMPRGWPYLQVEFRQDEVADSAGQEKWAAHFAAALAEAAPAMRAAGRS